MVDRLSLIKVIVNQVKDTKFSALKFMKYFANNLIDEPITLIRESSLTDISLFLSYLKKEDIDRVSKKLFEVYSQKIKSTKDV